MASMTAIVNFVNSQASAVGQLASVGGKYLILSKNSASLSDSVLSPETADLLNGSDVKSCYPQKILTGKLQAASSDFEISIHGVKGIDAYLKAQGASLNGSVAKSPLEANMGVLLAQTCNITVQDKLEVTVGDLKQPLKIMGIVSTHTQLDSELVVPIETANALSQNNNVSFIEFILKDGVNRQDAINRLTQSLPPDAKVVKVQQTGQFMQQTVGETLNFLSAWSLTVYFVVAAASYVVSTRLIVDSEYELGMLGAIGAKRGWVFFWVFSFSVLVTLAGAVLGLAAGLAGTQIAAAGLRWLWQSASVITFLEPLQFGQILLFSAVFSAVGCLYPAYMGMRRRL